LDPDELDAPFVSKPPAEKPAPAKPVGPLQFKRTSPGTPEAKAALGADEDGHAKVDSIDPGVTDWLWAVSFDDDDDREMTFNEVVAALKSGDIDGDTIVWREGMGDWKPVREVTEFAAALLERPIEFPSESQAPSRAPGAADAYESDSIPDDALDPPPDAREAWRKSTADLLAELSLGKTGPAVSGAEPVAPPPEPLTEPPARVASEPPRPGLASLRPSLIPKRGPARVIALIIVGVLVVLAVAGVVVLAIHGLAEEDDPTMSAQLPVGTTPGKGKTEPSSTADSAPAKKGQRKAVTGSSSADLASAITESLGPGGERDARGPKFNRKEAMRRLQEAADRASLCRPRDSEEQKGPAKVRVTFDPKTGRVKEAQVLGRYAGTATGKCIRLTMEGLRKLKRFSGEPVTIEQTVMIR
jgi:hypothetical protein